MFPTLRRLARAVSKSSRRAARAIRNLSRSGRVLRQYGRVQWRFQADDLYILGRPAVGTDGTIYAAGVGGHLYALTPNGGLKWIFRGKTPVVQSVSVGADNTAYFAGSNSVYAVNPNGTLKWEIVNPSGGSFAAGPNVGTGRKYLRRYQSCRSEQSTTRSDYDFTRRTNSKQPSGLFRTQKPVFIQPRNRLRLESILFRRLE